MSFVYRQIQHDFTHAGTIPPAAPKTYSGHDAGLNNPAMEAVHDVGPIPAGNWRIVQWHDTYEDKGPVVAQLEPVGHDAHGRSGFLIHGDNALGNFSASHGCIIAPRIVRDVLKSTGDTELEVISGNTEELVA